MHKEVLQEEVFKINEMLKETHVKLNGLIISNKNNCDVIDKRISERLGNLLAKPRCPWLLTTKFRTNN